jgi:hypothetical protein
MRSSWKVVVAVGLLAAPQLAAADDVEDQLQQMQERMSQLEEKLAATTDQLEATEEKAEEQQKLIQRAGLEERSAASGIASFFEQVEFGGWVTASYVYNTNDPNTGANVSGNVNTGGAPNTGTFGLADPFHPDTQTFQLDQLWFEMSKAATEDSRAGFGVDLVMGKTADFLTGSGGGSNGNNVDVYQAYAEYLAPLGSGINVKAGRFATVVGAEVAQSVYNWNITRGLVYSVLQPFNHVGLYISSEMDNGFDWGVGAVNSVFSNLNADTDNNAAAIWHLGYSQDSWGITFSGLYGGDNSTSTRDSVNCPAPGAGLCSNEDAVLLLDSVLTWDPSENLSTWIDVTYNMLTGNNNPAVGSDPWSVGVAVAGRLAITEATGFALRGEYLYANDNFLGIGAPTSDSNLWSLTGTLDHSLTENLIAKAEVRYEEGDQNGATNSFYQKGGANGCGGLGFQACSPRQVILAADVTYRF